MAFSGLQKDHSAARAAAEGRSTRYSGSGGYNNNRGGRDNRNGGYNNNRGDGYNNRSGQHGGSNYRYQDRGGSSFSGWATAPYNFIPYDRAHITPAVKREGKLYSGVIKCSFKALTPLLVAGPGKRSEDGKDEGGIREFMRVGGRAVIPGTSIKGMLRNYVEIISCSALAPVNPDRIFWRDVPSGDKTNYKSKFNNEEIEGGWLRKRGATYYLCQVKITRVPTSHPQCYETGRMKGKEKGYLFAEPVEGNYKELDYQVVQDFFTQMTSFQTTKWKQESRDITGKGARVFLTKDSNGKVNAIGLARYFRIGYKYKVSELAGDERQDCDFAEGLFGSVRGEAVRGRVQVSAGQFRSAPMFKLEDERKYIQGLPHASAIRHYIEQDSKRLGSCRIKFDALTNYNYEDAQLRGHKYYWHREVESSTTSDKKKVTSTLKPAAAGSEAEFEVRVDRISAEELGCLLKALRLPEGHAHRLGSGKAQGLGSIRITVNEVLVQEADQLYGSLKDRLAADGTAALGEQAQTECVQSFDRYVRAHTDPKQYDLTLRSLEAMTDIRNKPANDNTRTMPLERKAPEPNFAGTLALLPTALEVKKGV